MPVEKFLRWIVSKNLSNSLREWSPISNRKAKSRESSIITSADTFVIIATTSTLVTFYITKVKLLVIPLSTGSNFGLAFDKKVLYEIFVNKNHK